MFYNLPYELQYKVLSFSNPFKEYYKIIYNNSLLYIKNLNNNLKPEYYDFITLKEEYFNNNEIYLKYYKCKCHSQLSNLKNGYFQVWCDFYSEYIHDLNSPDCKLPKNINSKIKAHLKSKHHQNWLLTN